MISIENNEDNNLFKEEIITENDGSKTLKLWNVLCYDSDIDSLRMVHFSFPHFEPYEELNFKGNGKEIFTFTMEDI